ncbi:MAG: hypothetical protein HYX74_11940 [Acidobacteria bacterium]|nr:hypothetical protein [Acidobacteriota bacterium]
MSRKIWFRVAAFLISFVLVLAVLFYRSLKETKPETPPEEALLRYDTQSRSPGEIAAWIYETYNCHTCHTLTRTGVFGLTAQGNQLAKDFEGCAGMMEAVMQSVQIPQAQWSEKHRRTRINFERFGCTLCHQVGSTAVSLTAVGSRAASLHMTCPELMSAINR